MIRIKLKNKTSFKTNKRLKNKARIRKKVDGTGERPRLSVFRSGKHVYAQIVDDTTGKTLVAYSTLEGELKTKNVETSKKVGAEIAKRALAKNIKSVVFDRSGYVFHGRVKAVADGAREAGLSF
jgi:large subunit ribosomal protein L18